MSDINIKSSTLEAGISVIKDFLNKIIGPSADEFGLMLGDNLKMRRLKNQIKNLNKVKEICDQDNVLVKQLNLKVLFPYLEGVALEEDKDIQHIWANLLVNYLDSSITSINIVYPHILKSLSTSEVKFLKWLHDHPESGINTSLSHGEIEFELHEIHNLERLSLIEGEIKYFVKPTYGLTEVNWKKTDNFYLSKFGKEFLKACYR